MKIAWGECLSAPSHIFYFKSPDRTNRKTTNTMKNKYKFILIGTKCSVSKLSDNEIVKQVFDNQLIKTQTKYIAQSADMRYFLN